MLAANELVLCFGVNQTRTPNIAMMAAACGFDALYIDLEHNPTSLETAAGICVAAVGLGITPIARVSSHDPHDDAHPGLRRAGRHGPACQHRRRGRGRR